MGCDPMFPFVVFVACLFFFGGGVSLESTETNLGNIAVFGSLALGHHVHVIKVQ